MRMSKPYAGENAVWVNEPAIEILGGYGYVRENPVEQWHRDSKRLSVRQRPGTERDGHSDRWLIRRSVP